MSKPLDCTAGHYCLVKAIEQTKCPVKTYNDQINGEALEDCLSCPPGRYCATEGLPEPTGYCDAGSFCIIGAPAKSYTSLETKSDYGICPLNYYCLEGTGLPIPCGDGKWSNSVKGLKTADSCSDCTKGSYCAMSSAS
jgi:hypothetical protein